MLARPGAFSSVGRPSLTRPTRANPIVRTVLRSVIFLAWGAVMAALVASNRLPMGKELAAVGPLPAEAREQWYGVYASGRKVGYSHRARTPTSDGFDLESRTWTRLGMLGTTQVVTTALVAKTDRALRIRRFDFRLRSPAGEFSISGEARDGALEVSSSALGLQRMRVPVEAATALSQSVQDLLARERLETGKAFRYTIFDPLSSAPAPVAISVGPLETVPLPDGARSAYRIDEQFRDSSLRFWIEPGGEIVKEEGVLGLTMLRERDGAAATAGIERGAEVDFVAAASIPVARAIPSPRAARHLRLRVSQIPSLEALSFPPRQRLDEGVVTIEREDVDAAPRIARPVDATRFAEDLRATPFLQSDDTKIRAVAREIVGEGDDARTAARKILDWVHANLAKEATVSVPSALQVLAERKGDCNEHAVLYAALARAAGVPARMVAGTVYAEMGQGAPGAFYYHAWNQVWVGEWVAVDPTFGQFPADATHVAMVEGGPDRQVALAAMIGRIRFEVESSG